MKKLMAHAFSIFSSKKNEERTFGINDSFLGNGNGKLALDYGCGKGAVSVELLKRGYTVIGFDVDAGLKENLKDTTEKFGEFFVFVVSDETYLEQYKGAFDLIICRETLEHVPDREGLLNFFKRLLSPNGRIILSVPTSASEKFFCKLDKDWMEKSEHTDILEENYLESMFNQSGLQIENRSTDGFKWFIFWLLLAPFRIDHKMGNPFQVTLLVRIALNIVKFIEACPILEQWGNEIAPKSIFYYLSHKKKSLLCVYDYEDWILGTWGKKIQSIYGDKYNIFLLGMDAARSYEKLTKKIVDNVDAVLLLLPHPFEFFYSLRPKKIITAVHHWVEFADMYKAAITRSTYLITGATEWKNKILNVNPDAKICQVFSGYDSDYFEPAQRTSFFTERKVVLGFFGKFSSNEFDRKGTRHLVAMMEEISARQLGGHYKILITGDGWDEPVALIRALGIEVEYLGRVSKDDIPAIYKKIDVYLMLSDVEGGPATIPEGLASGCIVLSTKVGVSLDIIRDGVNGFFVDVQKIDSLVAKLEGLRNNPLYCQNISNNAVSYAREHLSYQQTFAPMGDFLEKVMAGSESHNCGSLPLVKASLQKISV